MNVLKSLQRSGKKTKMDYLKLTLDSLSVDEILSKVSAENCGAVSMFIGTTRDNFDGKKVLHLEYEAYEPMAMKVMKNMCGDIRQKWPDVHHIAISHRLGEVPVLQSSVVIAVSSPHRVESMAAVKYCIENLKGIDKHLAEQENTAKASKTRVMIDPSKVQVIASKEEINKRIKNYTDRKREQINLNNIQDFISHKTVDQDGLESTCARVDAVLIKRKDSKGHLKVLRVHNEWGPQTKLEKVPQPSAEAGCSRNLEINTVKSGIEERLTNAEIHLNLPKPVSADVYSRLKKIEEKILELESISPEYFSFWSDSASSKNAVNKSQPEGNSLKRMRFSADDIQDKINNLRAGSS